MADDITTSTRFSIFVPSPKARVNLGKPDPDAPFGYAGLSLQSDVNLLIDVNKAAIYQSGSHSLWQVGGKWLQWSNANMFMASTANNTVAADNKVLVVAGAGQGQVTALDHGSTMRMVDYNNLELHYRVEEVHNGLKALFYGDNWKQAQADAQATQLNQHDDGSYKAGGLLKEAHGLLDDLGFDANDRKSVLQPLEWEGDHLDMMMGPSSVYAALKAFDPYPAQAYNAASPYTLGYARFVQVINWLHRTVDVLRKVGPFITDNFLAKRVQNLIQAWQDGQEVLNNLLNIADIARFDRDKGEAASGGAWNESSGESANVVARLPVDSPATAAQLTSDAGPFTISDVDDPVVWVRDASGGTPHRVNFSDLLAQEPAKIYLEMNAKLTKVGVAGTADGALILDGTSVTYTHAIPAGATSHWGSLPSGFVWDATNTAVYKSNGSEFAASSSGGVTITDASNRFSATDTLAVVVDGTSYSAPLQSVSGIGANTRATALAAAINGVKSGAATASGTQVVIQSTQVGPTASVSASSSVMAALGTWVGASSMRGRGFGGTITAAQLSQRLAGVGNYVSTTSNDAVTLTHNTTGTSSYLEVTGPLAPTFFGKATATATGEDTSPRVRSGFFKGLSDMRSVQWEMSKWPEDVRNQIRPVYEAVGDLSAAVDRTKAFWDDLQAIVTGGFSPPKMLGLLGGDGVTIGSGGPIWGVGKNVTLVAAEPKEPDKDKFVRVGPANFEEWLKVGTEWEPSGLAGKFKVAPKKAGHGWSGNFRIVAAEDIVLTSKNIKQVALENVDVRGKTIALTSKASIALSSRTADVTLHGATIQLGALAQPANAKQQVTQSVQAEATTAVRLRTTHLAATLDDRKIAIGLYDAGGAAKVDTSKPRVQLDLSAGAETVEVGTGSNNGAIVHGLAVDKDGKVTVASSGELTINRAGGAGLKLDASAVTVTGQLKVGAVLVVRDTGMVAPGVIAPQVLPPLPRKAQLPIEYAALMAQARALAATITATHASLDTAKNAPLPLLPNPAAIAAKRALVRSLRTTLKAQRTQLAALRLKWAALCGEAAQLQMTDQDAGIAAGDRDVFETR